MVEAKEGLGRRAGNTVRSGWITQHFMPEFGTAPVTLAATSFLRDGDRAIVQMPPVPQGTFSMWLEERKLPPLDDAVLRKAATFIPMLSSEWQTTLDPESNEPPTDEGKFRYDGKFTDNPSAHGAWTAIAQVSAIDEFDATAKTSLGKIPFSKLSFQSDGTTDDSRWTGPAAA